MKNHSYLTFLVVRVCAIALLAACAIPAAHAQLYWDTNGATPGAGATPTGTWGTDAFWSTDSTGSIATGAYTSGSAVVFAAGDPQDAVNPYTVTLNGTQSASGITFQSPGAATISGGTSLQIGSGGVTATTNATISSATALTASQTWTIASGATLTQNGAMSGSYVLTKAGSGTLTLGAGAFTRDTTINAGVVKVTGSNTATIALHVVLADVAGAALDYSGLSGNTNLHSLSGGGSNGGNVILNGGTLWLNSTSGSNTFAGVISGSGSIQQYSGGTQVFSGLNTYTGTTSVRGGGTISFNSIANVGGGASSLGAPTSVANGTITIGQTTTSGTLQYTGSGHSSNRTINLGGTTGGATLDASGTGALVLSANLTATGVGAKTLTLTGNYTGDNTISGAIVDSSSGATSLTKTGAGKWVLSGTNTYTGTTTISSGTLQVGAGGSTGAIVGTSIVNDASLIFNRSDASAAYSGIISGTGNLIQAGSGTLTLSGSNSYSGSTTVTAGTLSFNSITNVSGGNSALGAPTTAGAGTIAVGSGATAAGIKYTGSGHSTDRVIDLAGTTGGATIDASGTGALTLSSALTATGAGAKTLTLTGNNTGANTIAAIVDSGSGATSLTKSGSGTWVLSENNTYTGTTTISAGTLQVGNGGTTGSIAGTSIVNSAALIFNRSDSFSYGGIISGAGTVTKNGAGTLTLTGANTGTGGLTINAGSVSVTGTGAVGHFSNNVALADVAGVTLDISGISGAELGVGLLSGGGSNGGNVALGSKRIYFSRSGTSTYGGVISGTGGQVMMYGDGTQILSGLNTYTGITTIRKNGTISINSIGDVGGGASALGAPTTTANGTISIGGGTENGTLQYTGSGHSSNRNFYLAGSTGGATLDASGTGALVLSGAFTSGAGSKTLTLTGNYTGNNTISSAIANNSVSNTTAVTKTGAGKWILSGANTYTGPTTVSTGTLLINGSTASGSAATVNGGTLGGSGSIGGSVTVNSGGTLAPGSSIQSLASGALALNTGSTFGYEVDSGVATSVGADLQVVNGTLDLVGTVTLTLSNLSVGTFADNTKFTLINYNGAWNNGLFTYNAILLNDGDTFTFNGQDWIIDYNASSGGENFNGEYLPSSSFVNITAVPEPTTWVLAAFGLATAGIFRRRKVG